MDQLQLAEIYKTVIGTDTSAKQLGYAPNLPNVHYHQTPPVISLADLDHIVAPPSTVDLVTIAQALHWFDLPEFYSQVKRILKKPHGVIAAWCYTLPEVNDAVDSIMSRFYHVDSKPYWDKARDLVDDEYRNIEFPFEPVEGLESTEPVRFTAERTMDLEGYLRYVMSWSAYNTAAEMGVELLTEEVVERFRCAWVEDGKMDKIARFPVFLRIGRVGDCN
ncbi:hypothetical protein Dimus_002137 [Dionaea muscipula]